MIFLTLLLIPALVALGFLIFGGRRVTLKEFLVHLGAMIVFAGICLLVIRWRNVSDTEYINGVVTSKAREEVHCRHPYCCAWCEVCSSDGKTTTCVPVCCGTCYDHPFDVDWNVYSNAGRDFTIDTLDRQGLREPPRWTATRVGEPVTWLHDFVNYVKAAPGTLFKRDTRDDEKRFPLPTYPLGVYDYWHADRLVTVGVARADANEWNRDIESVAGALGPVKQANIVIVLVKDQPLEYAEALRAKWLGGKKNDVITVIGLGEADAIVWADVMAWTYNEMVRVVLRDDLVALKKLDRALVISAIYNSVRDHYQRKHMADFKYLQASFAPTGTQYLVSILLGTIISICIGVFMLVNDLFGDEERDYQ